MKSKSKPKFQVYRWNGADIETVDVWEDAHMLPAGSGPFWLCSADDVMFLAKPGTLALSKQQLLNEQALRLAENKQFKAYRLDQANKMEEVLVINSNWYQPGATEPTWLCRNKDGGKFVTSPDNMYKRSEKLVWEDHLKQLREHVPYLEKTIAESQQELQSTKAEIVRVAARIEGLEEPK